MARLVSRGQGSPCAYIVGLDCQLLMRQINRGHGADGSMLIFQDIEPGFCKTRHMYN